MVEVWCSRIATREGFGATSSVAGSLGPHLIASSRLFTPLHLHSWVPYHLIHLSFANTCYTFSYRLGTFWLNHDTIDLIQICAAIVPGVPNTLNIYYKSQRQKNYSGCRTGLVLVRVEKREAIQQLLSLASTRRIGRSSMSFIPSSGYIIPQSETVTIIVAYFSFWTHPVIWDV